MIFADFFFNSQLIYQISMDNKNGIISNGINVDAVDLYDYAFDNIDEEILAEEIQNLKVSQEESNMPASNQMTIIGEKTIKEEKMDLTEQSDEKMKSESEWQKVSYSSLSSSSEIGGKFDMVIKKCVVDDEMKKMIIQQQLFHLHNLLSYQKIYQSNK